MLTRWNPFEEIARLQGDLFRPWQGAAGAERQPLLRPAVDIHEAENHIEVKAELPGLKAEDVRIDVRDGVLTLSGERKLEHEDKREGYHRVERFFGTFSRSFALPKTVDADNIQAAMKEGVLTVTLPKRPETQPRRIPVQASEGEESVQQREEQLRPHA